MRSGSKKSFVISFVDFTGMVSWLYHLFENFSLLLSSTLLSSVIKVQIWHWISCFEPCTSLSHFLQHFSHSFVWVRIWWFPIIFHFIIFFSKLLLNIFRLLLLFFSLLKSFLTLLNLPEKAAAILRSLITILQKNHSELNRNLFRILPHHPTALIIL